MPNIVQMKYYTGDQFNDVIPKTNADIVYTNPEATGIENKTNVEESLAQLKQDSLSQAVNINQLSENISNINNKIGTTSLPTTAQTLTGAIAETFTSVSNGKTAIASAITNRGISTSSTASWSTMSTNIGNIAKDGTAMSDQILLGYTAYGVNGTKYTGTYTPGIEVSFTGEIRNYVTGTYDTNTKILTLVFREFTTNGYVPGGGYYGVGTCNVAGTSQKLIRDDGYGVDIGFVCGSFYLDSTGTMKITNSNGYGSAMRFSSGTYQLLIT